VLLTSNPLNSLYYTTGMANSNANLKTGSNPISEK